jgi:hypothetical protein
MALHESAGSYCTDRSMDIQLDWTIIRSKMAAYEDRRAKDCNAEESSTEINTRIYCFDNAKLFAAGENVTQNNSRNIT